MEGAVIEKILNNNVVVAKKGTTDMILIGKGIGFNLPKGSVVPENRIEKVFINNNEEINQNYDKILSTVDSKIVGLSEEIIHNTELELDVKLSDPIHVSLPDHINFALSRYEKGLNMENPFLNELKGLYPKEFSLAEKGVNLINQRFNIQLKDDEIGFICLHIRAAISDSEVGKSYEYTKRIGAVMALISSLLGEAVDKNSLEYARTVTHINCMVERVKTGKTIKNLLLDTIKAEFVNEFDFAIKVSLKIEGIFGISVPEDEVGYLALHLKRLSDLNVLKK